MIEVRHHELPPRASVQRSPRRRARPARPGRMQRLTFVLDGIEARDYLSWGWDPEPPALGRELLSVATRAEPGGDRAVAELRWEHEPPPPRLAARAAGFLLVPEIAELLPATEERLGR